MKIGEVSRLLHISIDTVRYYIDLGLIIPGRHGNLFDFSDDCIEDIRWIHKLKDMGFSLKEIQHILSIRRNSNWVEPQEIAEYLTLLTRKKEELKDCVSQLLHKVEQIESEHTSFLESCNSAHQQIGVPLRALEYLRCPVCHSFFSVEQAQMNSRYIYSGRLFCCCGYELKIQDGIVDTPDAQMEESPEADLSRQKYRDLPATVITAMQHTYNYLLHRMMDLPLRDSVIMETDVNEFFYMYTHFRKIENRALFIVTDRFHSVLRMYKERIEYMKLDLDIVYLACSSEDYPLKPGCVDLKIDYFSANYRRYGAGQKCMGTAYVKSEQAVPAALSESNTAQPECCMRADGEIIGCYFSGADGDRSFSYDQYRRYMQQAGYRVLKEKNIACPREIGADNLFCLYEMGYLKKDPPPR